MSKKRLAVFASGTGTNFQAIYRNIENGSLDADIRVVISNNKNAGALLFAKSRNIRTELIYRKMFDSFDAMSIRMLEILDEEKIDLIILAGYMKLLHSDIVRKYSNRIMNVHPALLPSFGGKGYYGERVHKAVLEAGAKVSGVTVHFVNEEYDKGPIIQQRCVPVLDDDDPAALAARVLKVEHQIFSEAIDLFCKDVLTVNGNRVLIQGSE